MMYRHFHIRQACLLLGAFSVACLAAAPARALTEEEKALEAAIPETSLDSLKKHIEEHPEDLDFYFTFAALAKKQKKYDDAIWALETMLKQNPNLARVKLELGLLYVEVERFQDARQLFTEVLSSNPPAEVQANIKKVLAALDEHDKVHHFSATILAGFNHDSNANSAPSTGNVTVVDTTIPLGAGAGSKNDSHIYAALGLNHTYDIDVSSKRTSWRWKSSALTYGTEQDTIDNLNLRLYSLKTGPEIALPETPVRLSAMLGYNHIILDSESYLKNPRLDTTIDYMAMPDLIFSYAYGIEYRSFLNSVTTSTYHDRSGPTTQHTFSIKHILSEDALLEGAVMLRNESTKQLYYANDQVAFNLNYIQKFFESAFFSTNFGYKNTSYVLPDLLISVADREDDEFSAGFTLGYNFKSDLVGDFIVTSGYQFREVQSTIQNYAYDNHRVMFNVAKEFRY